MNEIDIISHKSIISLFRMKYDCNYTPGPGEMNTLQTSMSYNNVKKKYRV